VGKGKNDLKEVKKTENWLILEGYIYITENKKIFNIDYSYYYEKGTYSTDNIAHFDFSRYNC
jgi:hypothetical protein